MLYTLFHLFFLLSLLPLPGTPHMKEIRSGESQAWMKESYTVLIQHWDPDTINRISSEVLPFVFSVISLTSLSPQVSSTPCSLAWDSLHRSLPKHEILIPFLFVMIHSALTGSLIPLPLQAIPVYSQECVIGKFGVKYLRWRAPLNLVYATF